MNASAELDVTVLGTADAPSFPPGVLEALVGKGAALYDLPAAVYHAVEAMSNSGAVKIRRSPQHYKLMRSKASTPTPQMQFGTAVHEGVLEPDTFTQRVVRAPICDKRTKEGKAVWAEFVERSAGKIALSFDEFDRCLRTIDAVQTHPAARHLLDAAGENEVSVFWQDGEFKVPCKARFDRRVFGGLVDLKTAADASKDGFTRSIGAYEYHGQATWYFDAEEAVFDSTPEFFIFIVVESDEPFAVGVYELDRPSILAGRNLCIEARRRYRAALDSGKWEGYGDKIQTINAPRWALRDTY